MQVGIDAYSWLHKGGNFFCRGFAFIFCRVTLILLTSLFLPLSRWYDITKKMWFFSAYSCSMELCLNMEGDKKFQYLNYFTHRINLLRHHKITPVVVFDGGNIPCKAATEEERHRHVTALSSALISHLIHMDRLIASEFYRMPRLIFAFLLI